MRLKSCFRCRSENVSLYYADNSQYKIICNVCDLQSPRLNSEQEAIEWWNNSEAWISVNDRLPENRRHVLCYFKEIDCSFVGYIEWDMWHVKNYNQEQIKNLNLTHWQPLPERPGYK